MLILSAILTILVPPTAQLVQSMHFLNTDSQHTNDEGQEKEISFPLIPTTQSIPSGLRCPPSATTNFTKTQNQKPTQITQVTQPNK